MKKAISIILSAVLIFGMISFTPAFDKKVSADTEGIYTYSVSNGEATITDCDESASGEITIPDTLGGYPVVEIQIFAFSYCSEITSISIPNSVRRIGAEAFRYCRNLTSAIIPESVADMDCSVFHFCYNLTEIIVDKNNTVFSSIDGVLFFNDTLLLQYPGGKCGDYVVPDNVTDIAYQAFNDCDGLTSITLPSGISIWDCSFEDCSNLSKVTFKGNAISIGSNAFSECTCLSSLVIPNGITKIEDYCFSYCDSLTTLNIPDSVTSIGKGAFAACKSLRVVNIPSGLKSIGEFAFHYCTDLSLITIPDSVTAIGYGAFLDCNNLTIYGNKGSNAEIYSSENNIPFVIFNSEYLNVEISAINLTTSAVDYEVKIINANHQPKTAYLCIVLYDYKNQLIGVKCENIILDGALDSTLGVSIPIAKIKSSFVARSKAFLWNDLNQMIPLAEPAEDSTQIDI